MALAVEQESKPIFSPGPLSVGKFSLTPKIIFLKFSEMPIWAISDVFCSAVEGPELVKKTKVINPDIESAIIVEMTFFWGNNTISFY